MVILKMDKLRGNIVVSRRALLEESRKADRSKLLSDISEGDKLKGTIKNITDYGVFVDLGGLDGLIHVTDLSWKESIIQQKCLVLVKKLKSLLPNMTKKIIE